jgi:hypothetical protein
MHMYIKCQQFNLPDRMQDFPVPGTSDFKIFQGGSGLPDPHPNVPHAVLYNGNHESPNY